MANKQINDYDLKAVPDSTDSFLLQDESNNTLRTSLSALHKSKVGFYNHDNAGAAQTIVANGTWQRLNNDTLGPLTINNYRPTSMNAAGIWDPVTNQFDFSQLALGDEVQMRLDLDITPGSNNQDIDIRVLFDIGGVSFSLMVDHILPKTTDPVLNHIAYVRMFIGSLGVLANPAEIQIRGDGGNNITAYVHGWYVSLIRR